MALFLSTLFAAMAPSYKAIQTQMFSVPFFYILAFYVVLFFTEHMSIDQMRKAGVFVKAQNYNETHIACIVLGVGLGILFRRRITK